MLKFGLLVVYFALLVAVGIRCRAQASSVKGFVLGGRGIGAWLTAFAYGTSYFSAVVFVGYAGQFGWKYGLSATWAGIGNAVIGSFLAWTVLGRRTRLMSQHLDSATMPEFFGRRFDSKALKIAASVIIFVFLVPYTASLFNGLSRLFAMAFSVDYSVCILAMSILTAVYVVCGGYLATVITDFIQGVIMLVGLVAVICAVIASKGGFAAAVDALARVNDPAVSSTPGVFTSFFGPDPAGLAAVILLTSLGTWGLPQMVQKFYAIRNEDAVRKGTAISTLFAFVVAGGCYFFGGFGRLFADVVGVRPDGLPAGGFDAVVPAMLSCLGPGLIALTVILVMSASMSTLASLVLTSSSTVTSDFIKGTFVRRLSERAEVFVIRAFVLVFIAVSAALALVQYRSSVTFIAQLMGISWGALAGSFLAPFLFSLYWKGTTKVACWASFLFGSGLMTVNLLARDALPVCLQSPIVSGTIAMLAGFVLVPLVSVLTKAPDRRFTDALFSCYDRTHPVPARQALGQ